MQLAVRITLSPASPEPTYTGGPFASGVAQLDTANPPTADWQADRLVECGTFGERVDIATVGNYGQLLDSEMQISNHDKWFAAFQAAGAALEGALVEIGEALSSVDMTTRWTGTIADANFQGGDVEIRVESILASRHSMIPARTLTAQEFPTLRSDSEGAPVPIIYGPVVRTTPPSLLSTQDSRVALTIANTDNSSTVTEDRTSTWVAIGSGVGGVAAKYCPVVASINANGGAPGMQSSGHWIYDLAAGHTVYLSVTSGTGSGQDRKITTIDGGGQYYSYTEEPGGNVASAGFGWIGCNLAAPFDTLPDATSVISFFVQEVGAVLAVSDEGGASRVYVEKDGVDYSLVFTPSAPVTGVVAADISSEFRSGEDYAALDYYRPSEVYGITALSDGLTASAGNTATCLTRTAGISGTKYSDALCRGKFHMDTVTSEVLSSNPDIYLLVSVDAISPTAKLWAQFIGQRYDNTNDVVCQDTSTSIGIGESAVNCFSPAILSDGVSGAFSAYALKIPDLPMPLEKYRSFRFGIMAQDLPATPPEPMNLGSMIWTNGTTSVIVYLFSDSSEPAPQTGDWIRPDAQDSPKVTSEYYRDRFFFGSSHVGAHQDWRQITNVTTISSHSWQLDFVDPITCPTDCYVGILVPDSSMSTATEYECGLAFVHSAIPKDDTFMADFAAGRTYSAAWPALPTGKANGDPITLARDAALDMLYRDLGLGADAVDFASFQALPADPIRSALVARVDSAQRMADLCQQFNWVVGHDSDGRETATAWLSRVGSEDYDYSIDTGDVVEGTLTGVAVSDITDLINCPNFKYNWTQADGFRQESNVVDVTADPLTLNSGNYLRYLTGFGDFATALDVYESLHASYKISNRKNTGSFELPDVADASGVLWPLVGLDRFNWMGSRKPLLVMTVPDTSAAAFPTVGKRAKVRHKRYAPAWVYGTVVQWEHDPMEAETEIVVMVDPGALAEGLLYMDTIDPSGVVPLYTDMADGTTEQYIDQTGA